MAIDTNVTAPVNVTGTTVTNTVANHAENLEISTDRVLRGKKKNDKKGKRKAEYLAPKAGIMKQKFQGTYYNCNHPGHRAANCKMPKRAVDNGDKLYMINSATADIKSNKFVLSKNQMYVGKGYAVNENEPTSYREPVTSMEGHQWKEAIKSETDSILQNHTWELVDLPPGCKPLGYK
nr:zinc finger, CCHC-type [Tanacetum cinerariifolium]